MAKRLVITYGEQTLYDGEPEQMSWQEDSSIGSISVTAGPNQPNPVVAQLGDTIRAAIAARQQ